MRGGSNRQKPTKTKRFHQHPPVVNIFRRHQWLGLFELLKGYDDDITHEFPWHYVIKEKRVPLLL